MRALAFWTVGLVLVSNRPALAGVCGDGSIDLAEECDDGNLVDGDGCTSTCTVEQQCYEVGNTFSFFAWSDSYTTAGEYGVLRVFRDTVNRTRYPDRVIPRLWISTGDIPYMVMSEGELDKLNNTISNSSSGQKYPFTCSASNGKFPYFVAVGNHDVGGYGTWTADQQMDYWSNYLGPRLPTALLGAQNFTWGPDNGYDARTNYSFDYKNAHFVVLNEYFGDSAYPTSTPLGCIRPELLTWLEEDLEATTRPVKFVFGHEPAWSYCSTLPGYGGEYCPLTNPDNQDPPKRPRPYSTTGDWPGPFGSHWGDSLEDKKCPAGSRNTFWAALAAHGVTAFFSGHAHTYSGRLVSGNGTRRNDVPAYSKTGQVFDGSEGVWEVSTGQVHTTGGSLYVLTTVRDNLVTFEAFDQIGGGTTPEPYSLVESWSVRLPNSPAVSLTQPAAGATFTAPADIHLVAEASDPDGTVAEVSFLASATEIGTSTSPPYEMTWLNVPAGNYSLTAKARDDSGWTTTSVAVPITVYTTSPNAPPTAHGQAVTVVEDGVVDITLSGTDPEGEPLTYAIVSPPAQGTLSGSGASWSYTPAANYFGPDSFSFRVTDAAGQASDPAVVSITVTPVNDLPVAAFTPTPATGTAPLTVSLDATGSSDVEGPLASYAWSFGDGGTGSGVTASHTYTLAGSYVVTLTVSDAEGATATATKTVTVTVPADWWNAGWTRRNKLVFDASQRTTDLVNFPVLVKLDASRIDYGATKAGGADLRFVDADGVTVLPYEIEQWVAGGTSHVWVKVPRIDAGSTTDHVWMYYANPGAGAGTSAAAVWSGFRGVWHLTSFGDSTDLGHAGVNQGSTQESAGRIGAARRFSGSGQYVQVAHAADLAFAATGSYTLSAWVKLDRVPKGSTGVVTKSRNLSPWYGIGILPNKPWAALAPSADIAGAVVATGWSHVVVVQNGAAGTRQLYVNGVLSGSGTARAANGTGPLWFGGSAGVKNEYLEGVVDEVRLSGVARSADWVAAEWLSESNAFVTFQN